MAASVSRAAFYEAVGRGLTSWTAVETAMLDVFSRTLCCIVCGVPFANLDAMIVMGNIFFTTANVSSRIAMIDMLIYRAVRDDELESEWLSLKNVITRQSKRRNVLAHGVAIGHPDDEELELHPQMLDGRPSKEMNYSQVLSCEKSFSELAERIARLAVKLGQHLSHSHGPRVDRIPARPLRRPSKSES